MENKIFKVFGNTLLILSILLFLLINFVRPDDEDEVAMTGGVTLFLSIGFYFLSYRNKNQEVISTQNTNSIDDTNHNHKIPISNNNTENTIPLTCPQCKSPNTKRLRLCEWCGNQIV
jgi:hypothetical protein